MPDPIVATPPAGSGTGAPAATGAVATAAAAGTGAGAGAGAGAAGAGTNPADTSASGAAAGGSGDQNAGAASAAGAKPAAAGAGAPGAAGAPPEKYDLKLPADVPLDAAMVDRTAATAKTLGLSNAAAQGLLESVAKEVTEHQKAFIAAQQPGGAEWTKRESDWRAASLKDTEIGGSPEKLQANAELGLRVLDKFFDVSTKQFLVDSGLGSHPAVIRGFARIGKAMAEGTLVPGGNPPIPGKPSAAEAARNSELGGALLYGSR